MIKYGNIKMNNISSLPLLLKQLKLVSVLNNLEEIEQQAEQNKWSYGMFLQSLIELEVDSRYSSRIRRYVKEAKLPPGKTITTFKFEDTHSINRQQITAFAENNKWIKDCHNLIIFGPSGLGKTHLAAAIAHEAITQGTRVLFTKTTTLVQKLQEAKSNYHLPDALARFNKYPLLVLDDIGYAKKDELETSVLFELIADRYETGSIIITSNLVFKEWDQIFPDNMMAVAAIDRIIHHSTVINLTGTSYRKKESEKKKHF